VQRIGPRLGHRGDLDTAAPSKLGAESVADDLEFLNRVDVGWNSIWLPSFRLTPSSMKAAASERAPELLMLNAPNALDAVEPLRLLVDPSTVPGASCARSRKNRPLKGSSAIFFELMTSPIALVSVCTPETSTLTSTVEETLRRSAPRRPGRVAPPPR